MKSSIVLSLATLPLWATILSVVLASPVTITSSGLSRLSGLEKRGEFPACFDEEGNEGKSAGSQGNGEGSDVGRNS
ncbi:hypothetical protein BGX23_009309 [Mortierella sp. AD031]|nr:hypothetical protein BGX23_009309 [Mortierella sp. AD031]